MNALIKAFRRAALLFQIRAIEIQIAGADDCLRCVRDPFLTNRILMSRIRAKNELARLRSEYSALLPVGVVKIWRVA